MNRSILSTTLLALGAGALMLTSCGNEPTPINEEEVITTVNVTFTPTAGAAVTASWQDTDGDGGNDPVISGATLAANTTYAVNIEVLDESDAMDVEDITVEVREEGAEHQFFYAVTGANLTLTYADDDGAGNPIGIQADATTGDASTGNLTVTLRHEPAKDAAGVSDGDITNAGGETDVEVTLPITIQ